MKLYLISISFIYIVASSSIGLANNVYIIVMKKQEQKQTARWTLSDWFETKEKMRLMDQWLALNTNPASVFELYLGGEYTSYKPKVDTTQGDSTYIKAGFLGFSLYAFGLELKYRQTEEKDKIEKGFFHFRILGSSEQSTNIKLSYGMVKRDGDMDFTNHMLGSSLTLYLFDWIGLYGSYFHYLKKINNDKIELSGNEINAGAFLELWFFQLYGNWWQERLGFKLETANNKTINTGISAGLKLIF